MRLLLVGAFAYPHDQGSQIYFQEQAIALRAAGAKVALLTYGPGPSLAPGRAPSAGPDLDDPDRWRALDGFDHTALPAWAAPSSSRSGPQRGKPFADLCLALRLRRTLRGNGRGRASSNASKRFDAILAHHAEAALLALHALPRARPPVVYCAHTLLEHELPQYFELARQPALAAIGRRIDRRIARRTDAWIALTQSSERVIRSASSSPGRRIAPPLPDPRLARDEREAAAVARSHGLVPGRFFLYSGNLDPYQDLPLLERLADERRHRIEAPGRPPHRADARFPIVIATHDEPAHDERDELTARAVRSGAPGLRILRIRSPREANALVATARASVVPRRSVGGFPIKLVNSLAAGTPVVAFHGEEWGLADGRDSLLGSLDQPVASLARALDRLEADESLAARLGTGARATYLARHDPARVAAETLALVESLLV
jgi:glycosyltransferase involved in cell wall biosynthesis